MAYTQRIYNVILSLYDWWFRSWIIVSRQNDIARRYFGHLASECTLNLRDIGVFPQNRLNSWNLIFLRKLGDGEQLPSVEELYRNVSLIMVQSHRVLNRPRPMMPGIIQIGGCHIKPPKPLANDLQDYLDQSQNGVLIFSMGSLLPSAKMPIEWRNAFLAVLGRLKQNVVWKFEDEAVANVPANVRIERWLPQSDILAHPNVVLFITHGGQCTCSNSILESLQLNMHRLLLHNPMLTIFAGMASTFEGMARGVPMLCIPVFADQHRNSHKLAALGVARVLSIEQVTADKLALELDAMLADEQYAVRAKEVGRLFNDYLVHLMDEAMYWIEHVIESNGADYLKSKAVNLYWFQYALLDIWILPFAVVLALYLASKIVRILVRSSVRRRNRLSSSELLRKKT